MLRMYYIQHNKDHKFIKKKNNKGSQDAIDVYNLIFSVSKNISLWLLMRKNVKPRELPWEYAKWDLNA